MVNVWADGFGRWYAEVPNGLVDTRRAAGRAIRKALTERDAIGQGFRLRLEEVQAARGLAWATGRTVYREVTT